MRNLQAVICNVMLLKPLKRIWFNSLLLVPTYSIWTVFARIILLFGWKKKCPPAECKFTSSFFHWMQILLPFDSRLSRMRSSSTRFIFYKPFTLRLPFFHWMQIPLPFSSRQWRIWPEKLSHKSRILQTFHFETIIFFSLNANTYLLQ